MTDKIAVLLSICNSDNSFYLIESIDSILSQTYKNLYVLIGVDGKIRRELDEAISHFIQNDNIEIIRFDENRGLACVLNDLIKITREKGFAYIARMDADDICVRNRIEMQLSYLAEHLEVDVVGGSIEEIDEHSNKKGKVIHYPLTHDECRSFFRYRDCLAHPATCFKMRYFDKVQGYRNEYRKNQDTMLWFDGFKNGCIFANLPDTVLLYRVTDDFYHRRNGWKRAKQMLKDRFMINSALHYDITAYLFSIAMFGMTLTPSFIKKILYKFR